jgi:hypothetical protein
MQPKEFEKAMKLAVADIVAPKELLEELGFIWLAEAQARTHVITGLLRSSERFELVESNLFLTSDVEYAPFEEALHPFMSPALDASQPEFERRMYEYAEKLFGRVARG